MIVYTFLKNKVSLIAINPVTHNLGNWDISVCYKLAERLHFDPWALFGAFFQNYIGANRLYAPIMGTINEFDMTRIATLLLLSRCTTTSNAIVR